MQKWQHFLEDGNIIIILERRYLFRIYKGHLARHSQVFCDMMSLPQPDPPPPTTHSESLSIPSSWRFQGKLVDNGEDMMDGVPVLRLTDAAADFSNLLDVLLEITPLEPSFDMIGGALRVANKYMFDGVPFSCLI